MFIKRNMQDLIAEKWFILSPKQIRNKYANKKTQSKGVDKRNLHKFTKTDAFKKPATAYFLPPIFAVKSSRNCTISDMDNVGYYSVVFLHLHTQQ